MIVDGMDVCIELIHRNKTQNFFEEFFLKDERLATSFKELFQKIWNAAPSNDPLNNINVIKQN